MEKSYTRREEIAGAVIHLAGLIIPLVLLPLMLARCAGDPVAAAAVIFYGATLFAMFGISSAYHLMVPGKAKKLLRQFDHSAIYLLIVGTYAPIVFAALKNRAGYMVFAALLVLTLAGVCGKLLVGKKFHKIEVIIYLIMGWCCVFIGPTMLRELSASSLILLISGGVAYSAGVIFYVMRREFCHAVWHFFVLAGAVLHFFALLAMV